MRQEDILPGSAEFWQVWAGVLQYPSEFVVGTVGKSIIPADADGEASALQWGDFLEERGV